MLDRIDIHIEVPRVDYENLSGDRLCETSEMLRKRVGGENAIQLKLAAKQHKSNAAESCLCRVRFMYFSDLPYGWQVFRPAAGMGEDERFCLAVPLKHITALIRHCGSNTYRGTRFHPIWQGNGYVTLALFHYDLEILVFHVEKILH